MIQQWVDFSAGLAYITVGFQLSAFTEFLTAIEQLIAHPDWYPGMPVLEDLRQCYWIPPDTSREQWRDFIADRQSRLEGSRWAVVTRGDSPEIRSLLDAAAADAAPRGLTVRQFTNMIDAHMWLNPPTRV